MGVLFFRERQLNPEQHIDFSRCFVTLEIHVISNFAENGKRNAIKRFEEAPGRIEDSA